MLKEKYSLKSQLNSYLSKFDVNVFSTDGKVLYCKYCNVKVGYETRFNVLQHLTTDKHKKSIIRKAIKNQN